LVCPARSFFLDLPPTFRPSLIPFQPPAPQDTKKATPFEAACCDEALSWTKLYGFIR
jgi:hypothetical protein